MIRKLTGIFILLSFLLVKNTPLFAADQTQKAASVQQVPQDSEESQDDEKETKQLEITDEDFVYQSPAGLFSLSLTAKLDHRVFHYLKVIYFSLPYPPPDRGL